MKILNKNEFENRNKDRIILYHGTKSKFNAFDPKFMSSGWGEQAYGYGFYLTDYYEAARQYSRGGFVIEVSVPSEKYLSYKGISSAEKNTIAKKFFKYYTEVDEYGKEAYSTQEAKHDFWDMECRYLLDAEDGGDIYGTLASILGSDEDTSKFLNSIGYVGLKFPSYNADNGDKFTNYVIFNAKDIEILK